MPVTEEDYYRIRDNYPARTEYELVYDPKDKKIATIEIIGVEEGRIKYRDQFGGTGRIIFAHLNGWVNHSLIPVHEGPSLQIFLSTFSKV